MEFGERATEKVDGGGGWQGGADLTLMASALGDRKDSFSFAPMSSRRGCRRSFVMGMIRPSRDEYYGASQRCW
jgi:hypothetical protein